MKSTIDAAGRVVIPKGVRQAAGLRPGTKLKIEYRDGRVEIEPVLPPIRFVRKGKLLVATRRGVPPLTNDDVNRVIQEVREERMK
jgi:AbrB family looped-hinge helix DNA binding protein